MNLVFGLDAGFLMPTAVAARSADRFLSGGDQIVFLHDQLSDADVDRLRASVHNAMCTFVECSDRIHRSWVPPTHVTRAAFLRFLAPEILGEEQRCLYLDGDTLVRRSPAELEHIDLATSTGAIRSRVAPFVSSPGGVQDWLELGLPGTAPHFNSGVLLMNLDRWREHEITRRITDFMRRYGLSAAFADQEAVNVATAHDWTELDRTWNYVTHVTESFVQFPELEPADPHIAHFAGRSKPWVYGRSPIFTDEWFDVLDETPWRGTRPQPPVEPSGLRARARRTVKGTLASLRDYAR